VPQHPPSGDFSRFKSGNVQWPRAPKAKPLALPEVSAQARSHFVARVFDDVAQKHQPEFWCIAPNMRQWQKILLRNLPFWQEKIAELNRFLRSVVVLTGF
jgi:hypothetical protein